MGKTRFSNNPNDRSGYHMHGVGDDGAFIVANCAKQASSQECGCLRQKEQGGGT